MEFLGDPSVQPNGTEVAFDGRWNQAFYEQNHWGSAPGMCGGNCEGIYELVNGAVMRVTNAPFDCGAQPCESQETDATVSSDGTVAYELQSWVSQFNNNRWEPIQAQSDLLSRDSAGQNEKRWPTACDGTSPSNDPITDATVLAVDPVDSSRIIYGGCAETSSDNCVVDYTTGYDVLDSGASQSSAGDDTLLHTAADPNAACLNDAGTAIGDIGYSPDAGHVVELHGGYQAGIYTYANAANGGSSATELLALPNNWSIYSVRYIGANRIGFTAGPSSDTIDLYTIPTTCTPAHCDVSTGTGVTNLTGASYVNGDYILNTANFGYTSSTAAIKALTTTPPPPPPPCTTCTPPPPPPCTSCTGPPPPPCTTCKPSVKLTATVARITTQPLRTLLRKGLAVKVTCSAACQLSGSIKLKRSVLGTASKRLGKRGSVSFTVHVSRKGAAALKRHGRPRR
jgi:hypothetical protein